MCACCHCNGPFRSFECIEKQSKEDEGADGVHVNHVITACDEEFFETEVWRVLDEYLAQGRLHNTTDLGHYALSVPRAPPARAPAGQVGQVGQVAGASGPAPPPRGSWAAPPGRGGGGGAGG